MGQSFSHTFTQAFPPKPLFTQQSLTDLRGKVCLVTGANTGVGKELAQILYANNASVWIAARSEQKSLRAIEDIKRSTPGSKGSLTFLLLDLGDLSTIKGSVNHFLGAERNLHILFNNAGVQSSDPNAKTAQGHEIHLGVNCLGTFLFTRLLTAQIVKTAKAEAPGTVRVVWVSSSGTEIVGTKRTGVPLDHMDFQSDSPHLVKYAYSKAGNYLHGVEYARRYKSDGVISIPLNPGNLASDLYRDLRGPMKMVVWLTTYPSINGAYTELFAGLSPQITLENTGCWVVPFGRILPIRKDLEDVLKTEEEGGTDAARKWWAWTEKQIESFM